MPMFTTDKGIFEADIIESLFCNKLEKNIAY